MGMRNTHHWHCKNMAEHCIAYLRRMTWPSDFCDLLSEWKRQIALTLLCLIPDWDPYIGYTISPLHKKRWVLENFKWFEALLEPPRRSTGSVAGIVVLYAVIYAVVLKFSHTHRQANTHSVSSNPSQSTGRFSSLNFTPKYKFSKQHIRRLLQNGYALAFCLACELQNDLCDLLTAWTLRIPLRLLCFIPRSERLNG